MKKRKFKPSSPDVSFAIYNSYHFPGTDIPKDRGVMVTSHVVVKQRDWFFFLLQTEYGDLYKVVLDYERDEVRAVNIIYFDTVPIAISLAFLKTGFLFVAAESGNQYAFLTPAN
jgi:hypothetical protein